jgi:MEDS: MEthanogen/methylotroph, DcmR Sensory domain
MDPTDDKVNSRGKALMASSSAIRLGGSVLGLHVMCARFSTAMTTNIRRCSRSLRIDLECGEKAFHTVDPDRRDEHLQRLAKAGIDVAGARESGQFELRTWNDMHLHNGRFDQDKTLALLEDIVKEAKRQGFPLSRFVTHMEWALENRSGVDVLTSLCAKPEE